ncbi:DNA mismatch repair protein MutS [Candidatus Gracilibacteria bacterium]|nr:DNA mismatch repair protein MutS [Candidatus Gracilibacteria bacterium]
MNTLSYIIERIDQTLLENPGITVTEGNIIQDGYDEQVDTYRQTIATAKQWLDEYMNALIQASGISNLKIKYTAVSGYFIEVSKSQSHNAPKDWLQTQTLVNSLRYTTSELQDFQSRLQEAQQHMSEREYELFGNLREDILSHFDDMKKQSSCIANIDMICSFSQCAYENNYTKPEIHDGYDIQITDGRHPVIENLEGDFICNDLSMKESEYIHLITGPNMGGKSTFLRQNALITLLAHIGSFVPAKQAKIPLTDRIFSRVGASDNLFLGESTFMVEMQEVAHILHHSTQRSFVIIDEIGRGTSTYDGMSLAWAILKHNHDRIQSKTLFATHYHELVDESQKLSGVKNWSVSVGENDGKIIFYRKIIPGSVKKSYGLHVASLAGIQDEIIQEARDMLDQMESTHNTLPTQQMSLDNIPGEFSGCSSKYEQKIKSLDINSLTPLQALETLAKIQSDMK